MSHSLPSDSLHFGEEVVYFDWHSAEGGAPPFAGPQSHIIEGTVLLLQAGDGDGHTTFLCL
jgi:hypothetical protein